MVQLKKDDRLEMNCHVDGRGHRAGLNDMHRSRGIGGVDIGGKGVIFGT